MVMGQLSLMSTGFTKLAFYFFKVRLLRAFEKIKHISIFQVLSRYLGISNEMIVWRHIQWEAHLTVLTVVIQKSRGQPFFFPWGHTL